MHRFRLPVVALVLVAALSAAPAALARETVVTVDHGPITLTYIDADTPVAHAGAGRAGAVGLLRPGTQRRIGSLQADLLTTQANRPKQGKELRIGTLIFTIGNIANQINVQGVGIYALQAATLAQSSSATRPIVGGSGRYAGASGWCVSTHHADGTWTHAFHLLS